MTLLVGLDPGADGACVSVAEGAVAVRSAAGSLDALARRCGAPVTARSAWLLSALESGPDDCPLVVAVHGEDGEVRAAAALLLREADGRSRLALAGGTEGFRGGLVADGDAAALRLAIAIAETVYVRRVRRVELGPVPAGDAVLAALQRLLPGSWVEPGQDVPMVRRTGSAVLDDYLDAGMRRNLRAARNRLAADSAGTDVEIVSDEWTMMRLLPAMVRAFRNRDHAHGVRSPLDEPAGRRAWRTRAVRLLRAAGGELALLRIDGRLAAYVLGLHDGPAYRVVEGRFAADFARYSPGRIAAAAVLQRMLDDPRKDHLDWMTGTAPETLLAVNDRALTERLVWTDPGPSPRRQAAR